MVYDRGHAAFELGYEDKSRVVPSTGTGVLQQQGAGTLS